MVSRIGLIAGVMTAGVLAAACGSNGGPGYGAAPSDSPSAGGYDYGTPQAASPSPVASGTMIATGSTRLGNILVDSKGRTLYLFVADSGTSSACNSAACIKAWPPVLTKGAPQAGGGIDAALLGVTTRKDGTTEVTYAGHPLYYFISDTKPGDLKGQGLDAFGGPWYVVSPSGAQID